MWIFGFPKCEPRQLEALAKRVISTEDKPSDFAFLDPRLLRTPGVAVSECAAMTNRMGELARENIRLALEQFDRYSEEQEEIIRANEDKLDVYDHVFPHTTMPS